MSFPLQGLHRLLLTLACVCPLKSQAQDTRLSNVSVRTSAGGTDALITGFTIGPGPNKQVLVRAVGPTLGAFGVLGVLADPKLELYSGATKIAENDNWNATDAPTFASVDAFALGAGAKDAAIVTSLAPGSYTAQVSGIGGSGVALVEVYEVTGGTTRLVNLSTRAQVGTGANILIPGITISAGTGTRRLLLRAVGPTLGSFGVPGTLADPKLELYSDTTKIAENDNWGTPVGPAAADAATLAAAFADNGAFALTAGSRDAALLINLGAGSYTLQVSGVGNTTGAALVEVYDLSPSVPVNVTLTATKPTANENGTSAGEFTITRSGDTFNPLTVNYGISGTATNGVDYPTLTGTATIPAGATSVAIPLQPLADIAVEPTETVTLTLTEGTGYTLGTAISGTVSIIDNPVTLYLASLRPASNAPSSAGSTASGYATVLFDASTNTASVSVSFSNLSSAQSGAHLVLGATSGSAGTFVLNLPRGQVSGVLWNFTASGPYSSSALIDALRNGDISVQIDTANTPAGELRSALLPTRGSANFIAPAAPPALPNGALTSPSQTDAARFLIQATFGPTPATIAALQARGINGWLDDQLALPASSAVTALNADATTFPNPPRSDGTDYYYYLHWNWHAAWWKLALTAPDQLRQRVAFALSELLVVGNLSSIPVKAKVRYYDYLVSGAFSNFRQLLDDISQNPAMGQWLSFKGNQKANPVTGTAPDENYAREVMQLFTIGLVQLQPDGTLMLDATGQPIPTYNQAMVSEMAKVFTGWTWADSPAATTNTALFTSEYSPDPDRTLLSDGFTWLSPFRYYDAFHDKTSKSIVSLQQMAPLDAQPMVIPAGQTGPQDLKTALDTLFNHPNTGPFISRHLIKTLVTSNPSPAYVYRVAQVFANDGTGTRGNLGAVVRSILTDYEARSPAVLNNIGYGKIKEPLLRFSAFFRVLNASAPNGRFMDSFFGDPRAPGGYFPLGFMSYPMNQTGQQPLFARSVFNFFSPTYAPPGAVAAAGLVAPELEITDGSFSISIPNTFVDFLYRDNAKLPAPPSGPSPFIVLDYSVFTPNAQNPAALTDQLNLIFCGGQMAASTRAQILTAEQAMAAGTSDKERVQIGIHLTVVSPSGATQK